MAKKNNDISPQEALALMKSSFKKSSTKMLSDESAGIVSQWIDMNQVALNYIITGDLTRGFPYGRTVEYHGDNSTGKTLIALACAANALKDNALVFFYDVECSLDKEFAKKLGVDPDRILYNDEVDTVEDFEEQLEGIIRMKETTKSEQPILIILDSLAMLSTKHEMDAPDKSDMTKAKKLKQITRRLTRAMAKNKIGFLVLNHTIANISAAPFAPQKTTTGGSAIPFLASVRLKTSIFKKEKNLKTEDIDGVIIQVECIKNKITRPFRKAHIFFDYRTISINKYSGLLKILADRSVVEKKKVANRWRYFFEGLDFAEKEFPALIESKKLLPKINDALAKYEEEERKKVLEVTAISEDDDDIDKEIDEELEAEE